MSQDWNACFDAAYTPDQVADAARQVLSRAAQHTDDPEVLLLMDLISEVACKLRMDPQVEGGIGIMVNSPQGFFDGVPLEKTSQFAAYVSALKTGAVDNGTDQKLALQSATANALGQALDQGADLKGAEIKTTPLGFEHFIKQRQPKTGFLAKLFGKST